MKGPLTMSVTLVSLHSTITKVSNRLKPLINDTVDITQIDARDALIIIQRATGMIKKEKGFSTLLVDLQRAFDTLTKAWINFSLHDVQE